MSWKPPETSDNNEVMPGICYKISILLQLALVTMESLTVGTIFFISPSGIYRLLSGREPDWPSLLDFAENPAVRILLGMLPICYIIGLLYYFFFKRDIMNRMDRHSARFSSMVTVTTLIFCGLVMVIWKIYSGFV